MQTPSVPTPQPTDGYQAAPRVVYAESFTPRWRVTGALVIVKNRTGRLVHCYRGELLDYLNDEQRDHFLRKGLIEEVSESDLAQSDSRPSRRPPQAAVLDVNLDVASECMRDLDRLNVASNAGGPTARTALRDAGLSYANEVIANAVRARKEGLSSVADS